MTRLALSAALALAALFAPVVALADCELTQVADFKLDPASREPVVVGTINGQPVKVLIDTGVGESFVLRSAAASLGVTVTPTPASSRGAAPASSGLVRQLAVGGLTRSNLQLAVRDAPDAPLGVALVLGDDFLSRMDLEFDLAHGAVRVFQAKGCAPPQLVYWGQAYSQAPLTPWSADAPTALVEAMVDGRPVLAGLDSGAATSSLEAGAARQLGMQPTADPNVGRFASFALGDERINDVRLALTSADATSQPTSADLSRGAEGAPVLRIGADFLRAHRVFIDVDNHLVLFSYAGGPVFATDALAAR
jgi:predicted aspartyl protease